MNRVVFGLVMAVGVLGTGALAQSSKPVQQYSCLYDAAKAGDEAEVKRHLAAGANVKTGDGKLADMGYTALGAAARSGSTNVVAFLLVSGADVNAKDNFGGNALLEAVYGKHADVVRLLLDKGCNPNVTVDKAIGFGSSGMYLAEGDRTTPLMYAAKEGLADIVKILLAGGANVQAKDRSGKTATDVAKSEDIRKMLLEAPSQK